MPNSVCNEIFWWPVFYEKSVPGGIPTRVDKVDKKFQTDKKKFDIFAEQNQKWKIPAHLPNYFSGQKGVQENSLNMVVKKSGLLAEKKPAYCRKKIPAINCFKFGKLA